MSFSITLIISYLFILMMVAIFLYDFFILIIPNWLNIAVALLFLPFAYSISMPLETFGWHVLAGVVTLAFGFALFAFAQFGGGDAKAIAAIALWFGWNMDTLSFLLIMALLGGVFSILILIIRFMKLGDYLPEHIVQNKGIAAIVTPKLRIPYGVAIGAAAIIIYLPKIWSA